MATCSYSQLKVHNNGQVTAGSSASTATPLGDFSVRNHTINYPTGLFGSFNIQSVNNIQGWLAQNGYWKASSQQWEYLNTGPSTILNLVNGTFRIVNIPSGTGGSNVGSSAFTTRLQVSANGNVSIGHGNTYFSNTANRLYVNGNIVATGTITPSDKGLKKNINKLGAGLEEILQIETVTFQYDEKSGFNSDEEHIGVVAQDLQKILPSLVMENKAKQPLENTEFDKPTKYKEASGYLSVKDSELKYLLINAIQEQQMIINKLTKRVKLLEDK